MGSLIRLGRSFTASAALGCAVVIAPAASGSPDDTCAALRPALSEVTKGLHVVQDPDSGKVNLQSLPPQERASKVQEFTDHLRLASVLAHDTADKLDDPDKAAAVERFAAALDAYVGSIGPKSGQGDTKLKDAVAELKPASQDFADLVRSSCGE